MRLLKAFRESSDYSYRFALILLLSSLLYLALLLFQVYGPFYDVPSEHKTFYFWFSLYYAPLAILSLSILVYRPDFYQTAYAPFLPLSVVLSALFSGQLFFIEPMFDISATIALTGIFTIFLTGTQHGLRIKITYFILVVVANLVVYYILHQHVAYLEAIPVTHGLLSKISFIVIIIGLLAYAIYFFSRVAEQREFLIWEQHKLIEDVKRAQEEAEVRRSEAEARYTEAQRLQSELAREVTRTALAARYEALMRDQYGKPLPDFLRALLEYLRDDLGFVAGLAYQVKDRIIYEVVATYALPQYRGRTFSGGLLETAAAVQKPYLIATSPGHTLPLPGLAKLHPRYALYLPVYADVTGGGVIAVLELLFLHEPEAEKVALIGELLPRLGSYLWMQQAG